MSARLQVPGPLWSVGKPITRSMPASGKVESSDIIEPEKFSEFAEELLNPLIDLKRMDRKDHAFRLSSLDVGEKGLTGEGKLILAPKNQGVK